MQEADKDTPKGFANDKEKRQGFEQIVRQYSEKLYWTVRRIVINHDDANDVLQNVFIKVWKSIGDFEQRASLSTWLYRIAVNESLDFLRRQKDTASIDESGAGPTSPTICLPTTILTATGLRLSCKKPSPHSRRCNAWSSQCAITTR